MSYFQDLTEYTYLPGDIVKGTLNVGWLSRDYEFPKGEVPDEFIRRLLKLSTIPFNGTRGFHYCELCFKTIDKATYLNSINTPLIYEGKEYFLGSSEIHVKNQDGKVYSAPNLICHYILKHKYKPPEEFINATMAIDIDKTIKEEKQTKSN
ncbi:MAG: hypothetical protein WAX69_13020 [Victivallales bacterium]